MSLPLCVPSLVNMRVIDETAQQQTSVKEGLLLSPKHLPHQHSIVFTLLWVMSLKHSEITTDCIFCLKTWTQHSPWLIFCWSQSQVALLQFLLILRSCLRYVRALLLQCRSRLVKVRGRCSVHFYLQKLTACKGCKTVQIYNISVESNNSQISQANILKQLAESFWPKNNLNVK